MTGCHMYWGFWLKAGQFSEKWELITLDQFANFPSELFLQHVSLYVAAELQSG